MPPTEREEPPAVHWRIGGTPSPTGLDGNNKVTSYQGVTNRSPHARDGLTHFPLEARGGSTVKDKHFRIPEDQATDFEVLCKLLGIPEKQAGQIALREWVRRNRAQVSLEVWTEDAWIRSPYEQRADQTASHHPEGGPP